MSHHTHSNLTYTPYGLLQRVLDSTLNGIVVFTAIRDESGSIEDFAFGLINSVAARHFNGKNLPGRRLKSVLSSETPSPFPALFENVMLPGQPQQLEHSCILPGRTEPDWFRVSISPLDDGVTVCYEVITEEKNAVAATESLAREYREVLNSSANGIARYRVIRDASGEPVDLQATFVNETTERMAGFPQATLLSQPYSQIPRGPERLAMLSWLLEVARHGQADSYMLHAPDLDRYFEVTATPHGPDFMTLTYSDITAIKQAEEAHQKTAKLMQSMLDIAPVNIMVCQAIRDESGTITDFRHTLVNDQACAWIGLPCELFYEKTVRELQPLLRDPIAFAPYAAVVETREPMRLECERGGRWLSAQLVPFDDGFIAAGVDVTETNQYRKTLETKNRDLERTNENLRQFAYVASHDLQEPLRKIQSFGDILQGRYAPQLDTSGQDLVGRMQFAAKRMSSLIHDLLMFSRVSNNHLVQEPVDLNALMGSVVQDLEVLIAENAGTVTFDGLPTVTGDRMQLRQLFQNLISNALKFHQPGTPPRVQITCEVISGEALPPDVGLQPNQPYYHLEIQDNGIGFEMKYLDRIFQIFQRLHGKTSYSGTGIGLAICRKVTENHQGYLTAASELGEGAVFSVYLPVDN